jgi:hypothetical protein
VTSENLQRPEWLHVTHDLVVLVHKDDLVLLGKVPPGKAHADGIKRHGFQRLELPRLTICRILLADFFDIFSYTLQPPPAMFYSAFSLAHSKPFLLHPLASR